MSIYYQRLFNYMKNNQITSETKQLTAKGAVIQNQEKFNQYVKNQVKFGYWVIMVTSIFLVYVIIKKIVGLFI